MTAEYAAVNAIVRIDRAALGSSASVSQDWKSGRELAKARVVRHVREMSFWREVSFGSSAIGIGIGISISIGVGVGVGIRSLVVIFLLDGREDAYVLELERIRRTLDITARILFGVEFQSCLVHLIRAGQDY